MGHGKESPRQKMIGMMYLVLTALLALNVSAEVLNAFILVDNALVKSTTITKNKNEEIYTAFASAYETNKPKVGPWKEKADEVRKKTNELIDFMQELKCTIVKTADKSDEEFKKHGSVAIQKKDENNIPSQIMILQGKGLELKKKIEDYRTYVVGDVNKMEKYKKISEGILANLNTDEVEAHGTGGKIPWESANFQHLPLAGAITMLSKVQADIRNAEYDILSHLYGQIEAGAFKFNKIEAIVKSPTNYVLLGGKYTAEVFIAASDSTVKPRILVNNNPLEIKDGKGQYNGGASTVGNVKWGGVIELENPATGETLKYPFQSEYQVAAPSLVVSPTSMNVFYIGVDNPVDVSVSGIPQDKVFPAITDGSITKNPTGNGYIVKVLKPGNVNVSASVEIDGTRKDMGKMLFRVKRVPDPVAKCAGKTGGVIQKNELLAQTGIKADLENFDFNLKFDVVRFRVSASIGGYEEEAKSNSNKFSAEQIILMKKVQAGKKVYIEDIVVRGPDGADRSLPAISLQLR